MLVAQATSVGVVVAQSRSALKGKVLEVIDVQAYTYLRLKTADGEVWAAVNKAPVKTGAEVTIHDAMEMQDFESKALNRTFPSIMFGTLGDEAPALAAMPPGHPGIAAAMPAMPAGHPGMPGATSDAGRPSGTAARSWRRRCSGQRRRKRQGRESGRSGGAHDRRDLPGPRRAERRDGDRACEGREGHAERHGTYVGALARWLRLGERRQQRHAGHEQREPAVGDVVIAKGVVRTDVDLGYGYAYKVLVEDAVFAK